jgi:tetratricopeptide (TPR) repeat protein
MFRKKLFPCLIATFVFITTTILATAQIVQFRGRVTMKQTDGTTAPVVGAQVDVFRTDLPGKYETKTDKKGSFVFAGLPFVGQYVVSISAPGASPQARGPMRLQETDYTFELLPGDGKRFTKEEATQAASAGGQPQTGGQQKETEEQKKAREDYEKKVAENKKIEDTNNMVRKALEDGNAAFNKKDYAGAIIAYNGGIEADPTHPGAPVLLTNKALALVNRGVDYYNNFVRNKVEESKDLAYADFRQAAADSSRAVELLKAATPPTDPSGAANYKQNVLLALSARAESMYFFVTKLDQSKGEDGYAAFQEYLAAEIDPIKKSKSQVRMCNMLLEAGVSDKALIEFKKLIEEDPNNYAAYRGAGIALFQTQSKENYQEAANYLQLFVDKSPDSPEKEEVKGILDYLKSEGVKAQKINTPSKSTTTKKKPN